MHAAFPIIEAVRNHSWFCGRTMPTIWFYNFNNTLNDMLRDWLICEIRLRLQTAIRLDWLQLNQVKMFTTVEEILNKAPGPSLNGLAERAIQTFKSGLKKASESNTQTQLARFIVSLFTPLLGLVQQNSWWIGVLGLVWTWCIHLSQARQKAHYDRHTWYPRPSWRATYTPRARNTPFYLSSSCP